MEKTNYAAIDIGSNAVRLLIKSVDMEEGTASFVKEQLLRVPLRLGEDTFSVGTISKEKGKRLLRLMKSYRQLMKIYGVKRYRACATSAVRDAANGPELIREISRKTGIKIEVIGGEEEARLIYDNHIEEMLDRRYDYLYVDVGGGSTEISLISGGVLQSSRSYDIGTVRLLEGRVKEESVASLRNDMRELGAGHHLRSGYLSGDSRAVRRLGHPRADHRTGRRHHRQPLCRGCGAGRQALIRFPAVGGGLEYFAEDAE